MGSLGAKLPGFSKYFERSTGRGFSSIGRCIPKLPNSCKVFVKSFYQVFDVNNTLLLFRTLVQTKLNEAFKKEVKENQAHL
jgi:hypothetical protein